MNKIAGALSDADIYDAIAFEEIVIEGVGAEELYIGSNSVDLHLSGVAKKLQNEGKTIDVNEKDSVLFTEYNFKSLTINPGEFYLLSTKEHITLNDRIIGFLQGRSSLARLGLNIHAAGFFDSGFSGTATLEITNFTNSPITIYENMRICQIVFFRTVSPSMIPYNKKKDAKYNGQIEPKESKIYEEKV